MARGSAENRAAVDPATGKRDVAATGSDAGQVISAEWRVEDKKVTSLPYEA